MAVSGQMPENATFVADKITDVSNLEATVNTTLDITDFKVYDAFNLSVLDSLGQAWQPEEDLQISLDNLDIPSGIADGSIEVYRISDDPELTNGNTIACDQMLIEDVDAKAKTLTFDTDHFTAFVVGSSAKPSTSGGNADHEHQLVYTDLGNGTHRVTCKVEGCAYNLTKPCDFEKDPATGKNVCKICGGIKKAGEHTHQLRYKDNGDGTHTITCLVDDCDYKKIEDCTYQLDKDGVRKCSVCGAEKPRDHKHKLEIKDNGDGTHTITCKDLDCDYEEIEDCKWKKDEKTGKTICSVCGAEKKVLNHDHQLKITDLGNNKHKLECSDKNCAYEEIEDCKYVKNNKTGKYVCSVCGHSEGSKVKLVNTTLTEITDGDTITATGQMPENATLSVEKIADTSAIRECLYNADMTDFKIYDAYHIAILDGKGQVWQPMSAGKTVDISINGLDYNDDTNKDAVEVQRISKDPDLLQEGQDVAIDTMPGTANVAEKSVGFTTDHFTAFVVGESVINEDNYTYKWQIGAHVKALMNDDGRMVIKGTGTTYNCDESGISSYGEEFGNVTSVVIKNGVKNVGDNLFKGCEYLQSVTFGKNVKTIGNAAFKECKLQSVILPDATTSLGEEAFAENTTLTTVTVGKSLTTVGIGTFKKCAVKSTSVKEILKKIIDVPESLFYSNKITDDLVIPDGIKTIGVSAFSGTELKSVVIPSSVTNIYSNAFAYNTSMNTITLNGIPTMSSKAFAIDTDVNVREHFDVKSAYGTYQPGEIYYLEEFELGYSPFSLVNTKLRIGNFTNVKKLFAKLNGADEFNLDTGIFAGRIINAGIAVETLAAEDTVNLPQFGELDHTLYHMSLKYNNTQDEAFCLDIGESAHNGDSMWQTGICTNKAVRTIASIFYRSNGASLTYSQAQCLIWSAINGKKTESDFRSILTSLGMPNEKQDVFLWSYNNYKDKDLLKLYEWTEINCVRGSVNGHQRFVTMAGDYTQDDTTSVRVGDNAFAKVEYNADTRCNVLTIYGTGECWDQDKNHVFQSTVGNPSKFQLLGETAGYISKDQLFKNDNSNGMILKVEEGITYLGDYMFYGIELNYNCDNSVVFPNTLTTIGNWTLGGFPVWSTFCKNKYCKDITIPDAVTSIGIGGLNSLRCRNLTIGRNLKEWEIGTVVVKDSVFYNPVNVEKFDVIFNDCTAGTTYVGNTEKQIESAYTAERLVIGTSVKSLLASQFARDNIKKDAVFEYSGLDGHAFDGCVKKPAFSKIEFENTQLTNIPERCYYGQDSVTDIIIPNGIAVLGSESFAACTALVDITIPDSVKDYGVQVFYVDTFLGTTVNTTNPRMIKVADNQYDFTAELYSNTYPWDQDNRQKCKEGLYLKLFNGSNTWTDADNKENGNVLKVTIYKGKNYKYYECEATNNNGVYFIPVPIKEISSADKATLTLKSQEFLLKTDELTNLTVLSGFVNDNDSYKPMYSYGKLTTKMMVSNRYFKFEDTDYTNKLYGSYDNIEEFKNKEEKLIGDAITDYADYDPYPTIGMDGGNYNIHKSLYVPLQYSNININFVDTLSGKTLDTVNTVVDDELVDDTLTINGEKILKLCNGKSIKKYSNNMTGMSNKKNGGDYLYDGDVEFDYTGKYIDSDATTFNDVDFDVDNNNNIYVYVHFTYTMYIYYQNLHPSKNGGYGSEDIDIDVPDEKFDDNKMVTLKGSEIIDLFDEKFGELHDTDEYEYLGWTDEDENEINYGSEVKAYYSDGIYVYAKWEEKEKAPTYTVRFEDYDGTVIAEDSYKEGSVIDVPDDPTREGYEFAGWTPNVNYIARENVTYVATYEEIEKPKFFTIKFTDFDGSVISEDSYKEGTVINIPDDPSREGYEFAGWTPQLNYIARENVTYVATYEEIEKPKFFTIKFVDFDGSVISEDEYKEGSTIDIPDDPTREGYEFAGWTPQISYIAKENVTYVAFYEKKDSNNGNTPGTDPVDPTNPDNKPDKPDSGDNNNGGDNNGGGDNNEKPTVEPDKPSKPDSKPDNNIPNEGTDPTNPVNPDNNTPNDNNSNNGENGDSEDGTDGNLPDNANGGDDGGKNGEDNNKKPEKTPNSLDKTEDDTDNSSKSIVSAISNAFKDTAKAVKKVVKKAAPIAAATVPAAAVGYVILFWRRKKKTVQGVITTAGEPAKDYTVTLTGKETNETVIVNENGAFAFKGLQDDVVTVTVKNLTDNVILTSTIDLTKTDDAAFIAEEKLDNVDAVCEMTYKTYTLTVAID